jgi:subtilisin family serine protease
VWGVAPQARVLSISVLDGSGEISPQAIVDGIHAAVREGASVINMSFGQASDNTQVRAAIDFATARGAVVVAAAGDTASPTPLFPANIAGEVIAVGALDEAGKPSPYANPVGVNGVEAPGENLPAVRLQDGIVQVVGSDGSSMAAAIVSGSVALLEACVHTRTGSVLGEAGAVRALRESVGHGRWINLRGALRAVGC